MSKTLDGILQQFGLYCYESGKHVANNNPNPPQVGLQQSDAKQVILQWVNDEFLSVTPSNYPQIDDLLSSDEFYEAGGEYVLEKQRAILKQHGWKPLTNPKNIKEDE